MSVKVYGADWCGLTTRTLTYLDELGVPYEYIDVDSDKKGSEWVKKQNGGKEKKPTLDIAGLILSEPTNMELEAALRSQKILT